MTKNNFLRSKGFLLAILIAVGGIIFISLWRTFNNKDGEDNTTMEQKDTKEIFFLGAPRTQIDFAKHKSRFMNSYVTYTNSQGGQRHINPYLGLFLKVPWDEDDKLLNLFRSTNHQNTGIAAHYSATGEGDNLKITYILSLAVMHQNGSDYQISYYPFDIPGFCSDLNPFYLHLNNSSVGYQCIGENEFCSLRAAYDTNVLIRDPDSNNNPHVNTIDGHPHSCFFYGSELVKFYEDQDSADPRSFLYFFHGADDDIATNFEYHTPILVWGDVDGPNDLTNVNNGKPYTKKALDVGHLCPPNCNISSSYPLPCN